VSRRVHAEPAGREPREAGGVRVRKSGGRMSESELAWWLQAFGAEPDAGAGPAPARDQAGGRPAGAPPGPAAGEDEARWLRWMGVDPDDPRILDHEGEAWPEDED